MDSSNIRYHEFPQGCRLEWINFSGRGRAGNYRDRRCRWQHLDSAEFGCDCAVEWHCRGNSEFVVVGNNGAILTSGNGRDWSVRSSGVTADLKDVVWSGKYFVAVGENSTVLTSTDGSSWEAQSVSVADSMSGIAWSGSLFVVTTDSSSRNLFTSGDGRHWTVAQAQGVGTQGIAWNGSLFMAVTQDGSVFLV